ncbi:hypothetical protein P3T27_005968 [Kitasatospora sp. MAA19]|uniref:serine/threonine-protein kinase n=1 Tax=unclassified Kitasatospora TaxID=2633591 RepID=UPI002474690C|nr:serine/threonine-protein kinase [Kitasatospora sp. MAA19]MDH6709222.1 hypothetical protein [Kitasatospora sp. MAA19]
MPAHHEQPLNGRAASGLPFTPVDRADPNAPEIDGYRLHAKIGEGGMGTVYLSYSPAGQPVALKVVRQEHSADPRFLERFQREVQLARLVQGGYTVPVVDSRTDGARPWLAGGYLAGLSVEDAVRRHGPLPLETVLLLVAGVAEGLNAVHAAGIIHRDLKPSNVLLTADGPRVLDFGIAAALHRSSLTGTGQFLGTYPFSAPEQIKGARELTPALDVFPLGLLAHYAATGEHPFGEGDQTAMAYRIVHEEPELASCPAELRSLVAWCLAKDPARRPGTTEVIAACSAVAPQALRRGVDWLPQLIRTEIDARTVGAVPGRPVGEAAGSPPGWTPTAVGGATAYEPTQGLGFPPPQGGGFGPATATIGHAGTGYGTPPGEPGRKRSLLLVPVVIGGALLLARVGGAYAGSDPSPRPAPTVAPSGSSTPAAAPTGAAPSSAQPAATVRYQDKVLTWAASDCDQAHWLDLDQPAFGTGEIYDRQSTATADLSYQGCVIALDGGSGAIEPNPYSSNVKVGLADASVTTAAACQAAARERQVTMPAPVKDLKPGTTWCVITTDLRVAKLVFTKAGPPVKVGLRQQLNPTFELSVTLWDAP